MRLHCDRRVRARWRSTSSSAAAVRARVDSAQRRTPLRGRWVCRRREKLEKNARGAAGRIIQPLLLYSGIREVPAIPARPSPTFPMPSMLTTRRARQYRLSASARWNSDRGRAPRPAKTVPDSEFRAGSQSLGVAFAYACKKMLAASQMAGTCCEHSRLRTLGAGAAVRAARIGRWCRPSAFASAAGSISGALCSAAA